MRKVVADEEEFEAATRQGEKYFADGRVYVERYLVDPRHVEVQVLADAHGNVIHLGERDCSMQRRHQKLVEESPSPVLKQTVRRELCESAVRLIKAAEYTNAGTVEFLVGPVDLPAMRHDASHGGHAGAVLPPIGTGVDLIPAILVATFGNLLLIGAVALFVLLPLTQWLLSGIRRAPPPGGAGQPSR